MNGHGQKFFIMMQLLLEFITTPQQHFDLMRDKAANKYQQHSPKDPRMWACHAKRTMKTMARNYL